MKRIICAIMAVLTIMNLCACGQKAPTWQEQYDLGMRYLEEGNYAEAIIAFTAAIEIDPKRAEAYIGRGGAYISSGETAENLVAALADYEQAVELDDTNAEAYLGLADVYIRQGDYEKTLDILQKGLEKTGSNPSIADRLAEIEKQQQDSDNTDSRLGNASISINGSGYSMSLSLTVPGLPEAVYLDRGEDQSHGAVFKISISDGKQTFCVWTCIDISEGESQMVAVPNGDPCLQVLDTAIIDRSNDFFGWCNIETPITAVRSGDTITWNFEMPEQGFPVSAIQYAGYYLCYFDSPEGDLIWLQATYTVNNGALTYLNDKIVEDLGFMISEAEYFERFWGISA